MFILDSSNGQSNVIVDLFLVFIANYGSHRLEIYLCHKCWRVVKSSVRFCFSMILMKLMKDVPGASEKSGKIFFKDKNAKLHESKMIRFSSSKFMIFAACSACTSVVVLPV